MKYSLRSLMVVVALVPPLTFAVWFFSIDMSPRQSGYCATTFPRAHRGSIIGRSLASWGRRKSLGAAP